MSNSSINIGSQKICGNNLGTGSNVYKCNDPFNTLNFKSIDVAGAGLSINATGDTIILSADTTSGAGEVNTASNVGGGAYGLYTTKVGADLRFKSLASAGNVSLINSGDLVIISGDSAIAGAAGLVNEIQYNAGGGSGATGNTLAGNAAFVFSASTESVNIGNRGGGNTSGCRSLVQGLDNSAIGAYSHAQGRNNIACGESSSVMGRANVACAPQSAIIGGCANNIGINNTHAVIIGGTGVTLTGSDYTGTAVVSNLAIDTQPQSGSSDQVLIRNTSNGKVEYVSKASFGATDRFVTGATLTGGTVLTLARSQGLSNVIVDLVSLSGGSGSSDGVVSGGTTTPSDIVLERTEGLGDVTIDATNLGFWSTGGTTNLGSGGAVLNIGGGTNTLNFLTSTSLPRTAVCMNHASNNPRFDVQTTSTGGTCQSRLLASQTLTQFSFSEGGFIGGIRVGTVYDGINVFDGCGFGLYYDSDLSTGGIATHGARWIPDAGWVTGNTGGGGISAANNGLTTDGTTVVLGGSLTGDTIIDTNTNGFFVGNPSIGCSVGNNSVGFNNSYALGSTSFATNIATASGNTSFAVNNSTAGGNTSFAAGNSCAEGNTSAAFGNNTCATGTDSFVSGFLSKAYADRSHAEGNFSRTCAGATGAHAEGYYTQAAGCASHSEGARTRSVGFASHTGGLGCSVGGRFVIASGCAAFNHSRNTTSAAPGEGANGDYTAILGGINHNIASSVSRATIIGGDNIDLNAACYDDTTAVGCLAIFETPTTDNGNSNALVWNSTSKKLELNTSLGGGGSSSCGANTLIQLSDGAGGFSGDTSFRFKGCPTAALSLGIGNASTCAYGQCAVAIGAGSKSASFCSTAIGANACAVGVRTIAIGSAAQAYSTDDISIGNLAGDGVTGTTSCRIMIGACAGRNLANRFRGRDSIVIGRVAGSATDIGQGAIGLGSLSTPVGQDSIAIGFSAGVSTGANCAIAIGNRLEAGCAGSIAMGYAASGVLYNNVACSFGLTWGTSNPQHLFAKCNDSFMTFCTANDGILFSQSTGKTTTARVEISGSTPLALSAPPTGSGSDLVLVWDSTDSIVKTVTQGSISDERLKTNFKPIDNSVSALNYIDAYEFEYTEPAPDAGKKSYGLIAQDVEIHFPLSVSNNLELDGENYKTVDYKKLVPVLWDIVKKQEERIKELESKVN